MQQKLTITKASAGSGKTFHLTQEYIDRLLEGGPDSHRHILAATFTNKATAEMKGRIVEALAAEAAKQGPKGKAATAHLTALLHGYGAFGVSTIDAWLQTLMRAFAREAGESPDYRVELDEDAVLEAVADRILDEAGRDAAFARRLRGLALRNVEQGRSWNILPMIKEMARRFLDERFVLQLRRSGSAVTDEGAVDAIARDVDIRTAAFEARLKDVGERGLKALEADGRAVDSFKGKSRGPMTVLQKWAAGEVKELPAKIADTRDEAEGLSVAAVLDEGIALFGEPYREYRSLAAVRDSLPAMALYARIFSVLDGYLKEENAALLRRCGDRLADILTEANMPFVGEKTGRRIDHLLLDEAQDTSAMQWENIRPVASDILARGGSVLAVGDVKQAIYRWRDGDWTLLEGALEDSLGGGAAHAALNENWRSGRAIIEMNNTVFGGAAEALRGRGDEGLADRLAAIYAGCRQEVPQGRGGAADNGLARLTVLDGDDWREEALQRCADDIRGLRKEGYPYGGITVLVRKNSEGQAVARHLAEQGIPVISDDALAAGANACCAKIAASLALRCDDRELTKLEAEVLGVEEASGDTLYEAAAAAAAASLATEKDMPFVRTMLDAALDWQKTHGSDVAGFVQWWRETGAYKSVAAGEGQDAVRVMTIHKSKGLSLDAVIVPLAAEPFAASALLAPTMWCEAAGTLAPLGLVPLKAHSAKLAGTQFEEAYAEERTCQWIDTMNLMYVAMTRAKTRLLVYMPREETPEGKMPQTFAGLVQVILAGELAGGGYVEHGLTLPFARKEEAVKRRLKMRRLDCRRGDGRVVLVHKADTYFGNGEENPQAE